MMRGASSAPDVRPPGRSVFLRNTGYSLLQQMVNIGLAIALVPYLLWQLGTQGYGLWLILQLFNIFGLAALADLGFQGALIRHLVRRHAAGEVENFRRLLSTGLALFGVLGLVSAGLVLWFAQTAFVTLFDIPLEHRSAMRLALSVYAVNLAIAFPLLVVKSFYSGIQDVATLKLWEMSERIVSAALIVVVLFFQTSFIALVLCELTAIIVAAALFIALAKRRDPEWFAPGPRLVSRRGMQGVWGMSGLVFLYNLANQLFVKGPEVLVGVLLGPSSLAFFTIATRIPRLLKTLQSAANSAVLPHASLLDAHDSGQGSRQRFALAGLRISYLLIVPVSVFVVVFSPEILMVWLGADYTWLANLMRLAVIWQLAGLVGTFGGATFTSSEDLMRAVWAMLAVNLLLLGFVAAYLERIELPGLFLALLIGSLVGSAVMLRATRHANSFSYWQFARTVVAGPVALSTLLGGALFLGADKFASPFGDVTRLLAAAVAGVVYLALACRLILAPEERLMLDGLFAARRKTR